MEVAWPNEVVEELCAGGRGLAFSALISFKFWQQWPIAVALGDLQGFPTCDCGIREVSPMW